MTRWCLATSDGAGDGDGGGGERMFALAAGPGVGKTVIAGVLCARLQARVVGYFFCKHDSGEQSDPKRMLRTFAHHLSVHLPGYRELLLKQCRTLFAGSEDAALRKLDALSVKDLFEKLLKKPLKKLSAPKDPGGRR